MAKKQIEKTRKKLGRFSGNFKFVEMLFASESSAIYVPTNNANSHRDLMREMIL